MAEDWKVQVSVKYGDHMINLRGDTVADVGALLSELASKAEALHENTSVIDGGRSATEIVQKEKTWGARSQGGRTYTKSNSGSPSNFSGKPATQDTPTGENCSVHPSTGLKKVDGGVNKAGRKYSASIRCDGPPSHVVEWLGD